MYLQKLLICNLFGCQISYVKLVIVDIYIILRRDLLPANYYFIFPLQTVILHDKMSIICFQKDLWPSFFFNLKYHLSNKQNVYFTIQRFGPLRSRKLEELLNQMYETKYLCIKAHFDIIMG